LPSAAAAAADEDDDDLGQTNAKGAEEREPIKLSYMFSNYLKPDLPRINKHKKEEERGGEPKRQQETERPVKTTVTKNAPHNAWSGTQITTYSTNSV